MTYNDTSERDTVNAPKLLYTAEESATALGISRSRVFQLMASGTIASVKIGRSRRIARDELIRYVATLSGGHA